MATIQKVNNKKGISYRVLIRKKGLPVITKTFPRKNEAKQFILNLEGNRKSYLFLGNLNNKTTYRELVEDYLQNEYVGTNPQQQRSRLNHWLNQFGDKKVLNITKMDIKQGLNKLPKDFSNSTINKYKKVASVVFNYGIREYGLPDNPTRYIRSLPEKEGRTRFLSEAERTSLFKACRASHWEKLYLIVLLAITTGARKGELTKLRWNDIDFDRRTAYVSTTKNGQPKVLPLTDSVIKELQLFDTKDSSLIFASRIKEGVAYCFTKPWKRALEDADIKDFRFHDLRHTCASYLAQSGASLLEIAEILGHKQISVTKRYAHLCIEHKKKLINRVMAKL